MFKLITGYIVIAVIVVLAGFGVADLAEAKSRVSSKPSISRSYSAPKVVSRPAVVSKPYSAPSTTRVVSKQTPVYRSAPQKTTVIQKNYYGGGNGYRNGNYGGNYGGGGYSGGGSGLGTSIVGGAVGAAGGMMLMDALTEDEGEKALKLQEEQARIEEAEAQQERDDKQEALVEGQHQILENQKEEELREEVVADPFFQLSPELIPAK
jgi:hypothetical protein